MASSNTKAIKVKLFFAKLFAFILSILPVVICAIIALTSPAVKNWGKIVVICLLGVSLLASILNWFLNRMDVNRRRHLHCTVWLILLGLYIAVQGWLLPVLIILAVGSVIQDFILIPIVGNLQAQLERSKQTDDIMDRFNQ